MAELRWNPFMKDWVIIASHRQNRPQMPKDWCPFCPGSGKVPDDFTVLKYDNDFPALSPVPPEIDNVATDLYKVAKSYGKCEVILYSPKHDATLPELPIAHIRKLVDLWCERFEALKEDSKIKYIFIFENRGEAVGVTMPHPHGQLYAFSYIPGKIKMELDSCLEHFSRTGKCLICDMVKEETDFKWRVVFENEDFLVFVPFFADMPFETFIVSKSHKGTISEFSEREKTNLAAAIKGITGAYDVLFGYPFPYMMCMHQSPVNSGDYSDYYHFHIEFYPPMRTADKQKFDASCEKGAWAACNPSSPEHKAADLRQAYAKFTGKET